MEKGWFGLLRRRRRARTWRCIVKCKKHTAYPTSPPDANDAIRFQSRMLKVQPTSEHMGACISYKQRSLKQTDPLRGCCAPQPKLEGFEAHDVSRSSSQLGDTYMLLGAPVGSEAGHQIYRWTDIACIYTRMGALPHNPTVLVPVSTLQNTPPQILKSYLS